MQFVFIVSKVGSDLEYLHLNRCLLIKLLSWLEFPAQFITRHAKSYKPHLLDSKCYNCLDSPNVLTAALANSQPQASYLEINTAVTQYTKVVYNLSLIMVGFFKFYHKSGDAHCIYSHNMHPTVIHQLS